MRKHLKRFLGYLLTITLIFSDLSIAAYAEESVKAIENVTSTAETADDVAENIVTEEEPEIISELTDKRDEKTKHFAMSDGTIKACIYPQNVHYLEDGKYEEIDNTLVETVEDDKVFYKNKKNGFSVKVPETFSDDYIEFSDENGYVKFRLQGATNKKIEKIEKEQKKENKDKTVVNNVNDKAIFKSIKGDVDIEYDLAGNKLKETIILYKKTKNSFVFDVQTSAESAKLNTDNSISFFDENGVELYMIASPYMTDEVGEYSNAIETNLLKSETGYTLTYTPDYEWLSAKEREYPVRIDPTLFQAIYKETVTDTYISNVQTTSDPDIRGYWDVLNIGRRATTLSSGTQLTKRGLIRFEIPSEIGKNDCIIEAKLDLVHYTVPAAVSVDGIQIDVHELTSGFTEGGTWWGNQPTFDPIITDYTFVDTSNTFSGSTLSYDSYNITKLVNKWHNGGTNYGIMLKLHDEDTTVSSSEQVYYFAKQSTYYGSVSKFVEITYRNATGLEDYWSYTTQDFGQYGTGYVNNYNGNLVYVHDDASFHSLINGFTLSHVYNTNLSGTGVGHYGSGWRLNLVQKLEPVTVTGNSSVKYVYTDGDGTRHYFVQTAEGNIVDEDGLGLNFKEIDNGQLQYQLIDKDDNVYNFDKWYWLRQIIDSNGNIIDINYTQIDAVNRYITSITTSSGGNVHLTYDSNYMLTQVSDNAGRITKFEYLSGDLVQILYPDGSGVDFTYGNHYMNKINYSDGQCWNYTYSVNGRLKESCHIGKMNHVGRKTSFKYEHNQTIISDAQNRTLTYQFDTWGRAICVYDSEQNIYSQSFTEPSDDTKIFQNNKVAMASNGTVYVNNLLSNPVFSDGLNDWTKYKQNSEAQISVVTDEGLLTSNSVKITSSGTTIETILQAVSIESTSKQTYTISGYLKTENVRSSTRGGAGLEIVIYGEEQNRYIYTDVILGTTDETIDNGFQHVSTTVTLEENETINRVSAGLYNASGTVWIDSIQLELSESANTINLLGNSSFESNSGSNTLPKECFANFTAGDDGGVSTTETYDGMYSLRISGISSVKRYVWFTVNTLGKAGDVYSLGGWAKANAVANHSANDVTDFKLTAGVFYTTGEYVEFPIDLNENVSDWQYVMQNFIPKKDYNKILVYGSYNYNCNTAYFDSFFLYRDTMQTYQYDKEGNMVSMVDYANQQSSFEYTNNTLSRLVESRGSSYSYNYDEKNNLTNATSDVGISYSMAYDDEGNIICSTLTKEKIFQGIENGSYYIQNKNSGQYLTIEGSECNRANVYQQPITANKLQKWNIKHLSNGYYIIRPEGCSEHALSFLNRSVVNTTVMTGTTGADNESYDWSYWILSPNNDTEGSYKIITPTMAYTKYVTVAEASLEVGANIHMDYSKETDEQKWIFISVSENASSSSENIVCDTAYYIRNKYSGQYLTVEGSECNRANICQQPIQEEDIQKWNVKLLSNGYYIIRPEGCNEHTLSFENRSVVNTNVLLGVTGENNESYDWSHWILSPNNDEAGSYKIITCTEAYTKYITVANPSLATSGNVYMDYSGDSDYQNWIFVPVDERIVSSATYQDNGNYLHTATDERGNTTTYTYDTSRGLQTGVTDAKGNTTSYTYNALNDRLESVSSGNSTVSYQYETNGSLKNITTVNGNVYNFLYDSFGRTSKILIGNRLLSETIYRDNYFSLVSQLKYGNGVYKTYTYDNQDRLISEDVNGVEVRTYVYDKNGNVAKINDLLTGVTMTFRYDLIGRTVEVKTSNNQSVNYIYDNFNRLSLFKWTIDNTELSSEYIYGNNSDTVQKAGLIYGIKLNNVQQLEYQYDELSRLKTKNILTTTPVVTEYEYHDGVNSNTTTTLVKTVKNGNDTYEYTYDELGYITSVVKNGTLIETYTYDSLGQLVSTTYNGDTYTYTYDNGGNIMQVKKNGEVVKNYTYGNSEWKDLLTALNGETITYDEIGNPLTYRNEMNFTWQNGRQLASVSQNGNAVATYTYNADGLRTSKTVGEITTEYYWMNGVLYGQKTGMEYIFFLYDENGRAYGFLLKNGTRQSYYYYELNLQGDIIGIIDSTGTKIVEYTYGAWGDILSVTGTHADTIGQRNPLRYRGYYYDAETGFYYLQSRYYDPEIGRFINADGQLNPGILGVNLFIYCENNPISRSDSTGKWFGLDDMFTGLVDEIIVVGFLGILSLAGSKSAQNTLQDLTSYLSDAFGSGKSANTVVSTQKQLTNIAIKHGYGHCDTAAKEMARVLKKKGEQYKVIKLQCAWKSPGERVWCLSRHQLAGTNSYHVGVEYKGMVYCTMHPYGMLENIWLYDFECYCGLMEAERLEW